jgi:hypothetical protein
MNFRDPSNLVIFYGVLIAAIGVGLGIQIVASIDTGMGWWRVGIGVFIVAAMIYAHLGALRRSAKEE